MYMYRRVPCIRNALHFEKYSRQAKCATTRRAPPFVRGNHLSNTEYPCDPISLKLVSNAANSIGRTRRATL